MNRAMTKRIVSWIQASLKTTRTGNGWWVGLVLVGSSCVALRAQVPSSCYRVESVATPVGLAPEVSAIGFAPDGRLVACFRLGQVWLLDVSAGKWEPFASGLLWPLGVLAGKPGEFFIAQMPELTRVVDTDADGKADLYETVCDQWGLGGNYHEFLAGPVRDRRGNFYVALGCVSSGGELRFPVRGEYRKRTWQGKRYGHYSPVPYRGWVVRVTPAGKMEPVASGLRQPNGILLHPSGDLFVVDNQGDWVGTSPLHHVTQGAFHGHPASLVWDPAFKGRTLDEIPVKELAARRKMPAIQFPQNDMAGSTTQPVCDTTEGRFGPYRGQLIVGEWSHARLHRVFLEKVGGEYQGACFPFLEGGGLRRGNHRLVFSPKGNLYVAQVSRLWGGTGEGLQRVTWTGEIPMDILAMRLTRSGFELEFTRPVDPATVECEGAFSLRHYHYRYHPAYGSPKVGVTPVKIIRSRVEKDGMRVRLEVAALVEGRVYDLRPKGIQARDGTPLCTRMAAYTLNRLHRRR